jgi:hypothetical protein
MPGDAIRQSLSINGTTLRVCDQEIDLGSRKIFSIAMGKAAAPMSYALEQQLGESFAGGFMSGPVPQPRF